jgi:purine-binding chemotaxis protein CheW
MNIADIRKKAQIGKATSLPNKVPLETQSSEVPHLTEVPIEIINEPPECPVVISEPFAGTAVMAQHLSYRFDPLAILLEGRDIADSNEQVDANLPNVISTERGDIQELLWFRVSSEEYALNIMDIKEIIKPREVTEVPRVPDFVQGVLSLRGIIIPVIDMCKRLGLNRTTTTSKMRIIVVKKGDSYCGVLVDEVIQVVKISNLSIEPPPAVLEGIDRDFVTGIGRFEGRMLILLFMEKILDISVV